jgi:excinuclease ABC subunit A
MVSQLPDGYSTKVAERGAQFSGGQKQLIAMTRAIFGEHKTHFIFDEPTTGLHFHDIKKLLKSFDALIDNGHSIMVVEHNLDLIKCADYVIDMGPEGGDFGGQMVAFGTPEDIVKNRKSVTGKYLKEKL